MSTSGLAPPGSSTYQSGTMYVGDGTWDAQRNTFLLPNLVGLNFNTMRYNGMGNRFLELPGYHSLIRGHGVVAAITFLAIVPAAIMINRFYTRKPWIAVRYHIWLQILTVLLTTVVFVLGYFAVGPQRSLTNPHHGIGLAIYVLVLVQFIGGWLVHSRERRKRQIHVPLKAVLHKWLGRFIALLALAQIPLGLTLYGSPLALFVLYALAVFALLIIYFALDYVQERSSREYNSEYSYASGSGSVINDRRQHGRFGALAEGAAAGAGLAALANRFRRRSGNQDRPEVVGSRRHSGSQVEEEKFSEYEEDRRGRGKWTDRLLGLGAAVGAGALAAKLLGRKRERDVEIRNDEVRDDGVRNDELDNRRFGPPPGRATEISEDSLGRVEEGRTRPSRQHPLNQPLNPPLTQPLHHRRSTSSLSYESYLSGSPSRRRGHGLRDTVAAIGAFGFARNILNQRRKRKEDRRLEAIRQQEIEDERLTRANSKRLTGDGFPRRAGRRGSLTTSTDYSADDRPRRDHGVPPPLASGAIPAGVAGAAAGAALADRDRERDRQHTTLGASNPVIAGAPPGEQLSRPPILQDQGIHHDSSGSEMFTSTGGRQHRRHHSGRDAAVAGIAGGAAGLLAGEALSNRREESRNRREQSRNRRASAGEGSVASPPVSVKVKMHSDGRHVTLRRLPEQEAAAERAARRRSRDSKGRRRRGNSASSLSGTDIGGGERWRRSEAIERQQAAEMQREREAQQQPQPVYPPPPPLQQQQQAQPQVQPQQQYNPPIHNPHNLALPNTLPPPPPIPQNTTPVGQPLSRPGTANLSSPGTYDGTATEASADYANNRRRRRAERAQAKLTREGAGKVEFT